MLERILKSDGLRAMGVLTGATTIGQLAIFALLPVLTRIYDPIDFGRHGLLMAFVGIASVGVCLSLELAIIQARSAKEADELCAAALRSVPITSLLSMLGFSLLVTYELLGYGSLPSWSILLAGLMVAMNGLYLASRYRVLREEKYSSLARATILQSGGRAIAPIGWSLVFPSWAGLALGELTGRLLGVKSLLAPLSRDLLATDVFASSHAWWRIVCRERKYTVVLLSTVLLDSCASQLIMPLLASSFGPKSAGEYFLAAAVLVAPSALLGSAAADVLHSRGARMYKEFPSALPSLLNRAALLLLLVGSGIYLTVYFAAPMMFPFLFGVKWALMAPTAQAMTPFMIVAFVASPCSRLLLVVNRSSLKVISDIVRLIGVSLIITSASKYGFTFETTMWILSWFLAFAYGLYFILTSFAVHVSSTTGTRENRITPIGR